MFVQFRVHEVVNKLQQRKDWAWNKRKNDYFSDSSLVKKSKWAFLRGGPGRLGPAELILEQVENLTRHPNVCAQGYQNLPVLWPNHGFRFKMNFHSFH